MYSNSKRLPQVSYFVLAVANFSANWTRATSQLLQGTVFRIFLIILDDSATGPTVSNYFFSFLFYLSIAGAINPWAFPISNILMLVKRLYGAQEALDQIWHGHNVFRPRAWESLISMERTIELVAPAWGKRFWSVVFMTKYQKDNFLFERFVDA